MLIGVDIGGTNLRIGVIDDLKVIEEQRVHADFSGICRRNPPDQALQKITDMLGQALRETLAKYPACTAIGIGFPGFVDPVGGWISQSPNLPGLKDVNLVSTLQEQLACPVVVENDALAAAFGEYRLHQYQGHGLIYLGLGTGVGGGLIVAGAPYQGEHGVAMEVGHLIVAPNGRPCGCGNLGCMEQYASASGVSRSYLDATGAHKAAAEIAALAEAGDANAQAAFDLAGETLAQVLAHLLKVVDISHVVIGGGMSHAWPLMRAAFDRRLQADLIPVLRGRIDIAVSLTGDQAGMIGAAMLAAMHAAG